MLVLTRKYNQSIMIGEEIEIVVVDIKGDQVKIGIRAPKNCTILRSEIYEQIQRENTLAAAARPDALSRVDVLLPPRTPPVAPPGSPDAPAAPAPPRRTGVVIRKKDFPPDGPGRS